MIIHHHLGLGDHFICYGLVRHFAESQNVLLLCKEQNYPTVYDMYKGTNVTVLSITDEAQAEIQYKDYPNYTRIGFTSECETEDEFGREFYKQAGLPYETRWKYELPTSNTQIWQGTANLDNGDILVADSEEFQIFIGKPNYTRMSDLGSMLQWKNMIEKAKEIHCIESSVRQFIEFCNPKGRLILHYFEEKSWRIVPSRHEWELIKYEKTK